MARAARGPRPAAQARGSAPLPRQRRSVSASWDRGSVLLEVALAIPALVAVAIALTWAVSLGATYVRALDVAQSAARQVARGGVPGPAPGGFDTDVRVEAGLVIARVTTEVPAPVPLLRGITATVSADAVAAVESPWNGALP